MLYTAKCYWPGVTEDKLRIASERAREGGAKRNIAYRGAIYLPGDELVLCLFEAPSREAVKQSSERAGMPCERVIESVWIEPRGKGGES